MPLTIATAPTPMQIGTRPTAPRFWLGSMLDMCAFIAKRNGIAQADFFTWDLVLGSEHSRLVADFYIRLRRLD